MLSGVIADPNGGAFPDAPLSAIADRQFAENLLMSGRSSAKVQQAS
jgi:hypothetical protein